MAGPGSNGGGGLVGARHLVNRGYIVRVVLSESDSLTPVPAHQADILARMGAVIATAPAPADLISTHPKFRCRVADAGARPARQR